MSDTRKVTISAEPLLKGRSRFLVGGHDITPYVRAFTVRAVAGDLMVIDVVLLAGMELTAEGVVVQQVEAVDA